MTIALLEAQSFGLGRLAQAAAQAGQRLLLLTGDRSLYGYELGRLTDDDLLVHDIDTTDVDACEAALRQVPGLAGLVNSTDTWAVPGAELARRLGLPGPDVDAVRTLRDKGAVRAALHTAGLSRATSVVVPPPATGAPARQRLAELGLPLVVKDSAGTSSRSAWLVRDGHELDEALREAERAALKGHLIAEPYFPGPMYSAETITWQGETRLLGTSSRVLSPEPWRREEATAFPVAFPPGDLAALERWVRQVLAAVGLRQGFAHTELVATIDGPEVVEVNPRIGGAVIGEAMCRSLGTNVHAAMISIALGERPALLDEPLANGPGTALVRLYAPRRGTLAGWSGLNRLAALPGDPDWFPTARPGDRIDHLADQRGCTGIVLAEAPTAELALHRALAAAGTVTPQVAAAPG